MRSSLFVAWLLVGALATAPVSAAPAKAVVPVEGISEHTLPNGLRVLLFPDASKPLVTVNITYLVGSRHEGLGEAGMAHLLEHMLFKGTPRHKDMDAEFDARGARSNASTDTDRTNYFETVQATKENLDWALELEADRMVHARITAADLQSEFSVVRNEFEINESEPASVLDERMLESAYLWHAYGRPVIGSRSDIERVPVDNLRAFYTRHYQPDNAVLVVAGKFDPGAALKQIAATFGRIPRPKRVLLHPYTTEPVQDGERAITLRRAGDVQLVAAMYHGVSAADPDAPAEQALVDVLTNQPSGRLYKALIGPGLAARVDGGGTLQVDPGVFQLIATVRTDKKLDVARDKMLEILEGLAKSPITTEEVERWRTKALREIELELTDPEHVGLGLSEWVAIDWRMKFIYRDRVRAVTPAQVQAFALRYLKRSNRTLGLFLPEATSDRAPLPSTLDVKSVVAGYHGDAQTTPTGEAFLATVENIDRRTERVTLANGMKLVLLPKRTRGGVVQVELVVRSGDETTLGERAQLGGFVLQAALRGTAKHSYSQLRDLFEKLKVDATQDEGIDTRSDGAHFGFTTVRASVPEMLTLLAEIVRSPSFAPDQLEALRREQLAALEQALQNPMSVGMTVLQQRAAPWPKGDPRHVDSAEEQIARVQAITREELVEFHKTRWGGDGAALVMVGDFDAAEVKAVLERELGTWRAPQAWKRLPRPFRTSAPGAEHIALADKATAFVGAAAAIELRDDAPEYPALLLGNFIYGGSSKSRLWQRLREKDGLSYGAHSFADASPLDQSARFLAFAFCAPKNAPRALTAVTAELSRLLEKGVTEVELQAAKKAYQAQFDSTLAVDEDVLRTFVDLVPTGRTLAFLRDQNAKIQAVTAAEVTATLKRYLAVECLSKITVGDLKMGPARAP